MKPMYIQNEGHVCVRGRNTVTEISRDRDKDIERDKETERNLFFLSNSCEDELHLLKLSLIKASVLLIIPIKSFLT